MDRYLIVRIINSVGFINRLEPLKLCNNYDEAESELKNIDKSKYYSSDQFEIVTLNEKKFNFKINK